MKIPHLVLLVAMPLTAACAERQPPVDRQIEGTIYEEVDVDPNAWMWGLAAIIALAVVDDSAGGPAACGCGFN